MTRASDQNAILFDQVALKSAQGHLLLDNIQLEIPTGQTTALIGRSGSGKTTLLRMVNRLALPSQGRVLVEGKATTDWDPILLRRSIGYVIQETGLLPHFTAERNIGIVPEISGQPRAAIDARVRELFSLVGLDQTTFATRLPHELSGGQRQRVGLARALAAEPKVLLMDEPFGALDPLTRVEMQDVVRDLLPRVQKTVLLVTHDLDEALYLASNIVLVDAGRIVARSSSKDFLTSKVPAVQNFVRAVHRRGGSGAEAAT